MNENSPICASPAETRSAVASGWPRSSTTATAASDFATRITNSTAATPERLAQQDGRVEQHADRDEEQHGEGVAQRQAVGRGLVAEVALAQDHAGEEGAEREGDPEQLGRAVGDAERGGQHARG